MRDKSRKKSEKETMDIEIDKKSGFCFGVVYAIQKAEEELKENDTLYCLGDIVHNDVEVKRLESVGLITINYTEFLELKNCTVLLRAHGEPPATYQHAIENNIRLIDASCPVVLKLQASIKNGFDKIQNTKGQIVIYGKEGHAEVNGLVGQTNGNAIVVSDTSDLYKIDFTKPVSIFSQTTKSLSGYAKITDEIEHRMRQHFGEDTDMPLTKNHTICGQVSRRNIELMEFAKNHEVILFVSGRKSSNGKILYQVCKKHNQYTYFISSKQDIEMQWFVNVQSIGICGATSTPRWLMEEIKNKLHSLLTNKNTN